MAAHLILAVAGLTSAWAMLSVVGGERERLMQHAELRRRSSARDDAPKPASPASTAAPSAQSASRR